jgi:hypothetical protein
MFSIWVSSSHDAVTGSDTLCCSTNLPTSPLVGRIVFLTCVLEPFVPFLRTN